jgi:methionyl aminopeptidase
MDRSTQTAPRQLRSAREIALMRRAGLVVWEAHQAAARAIRPGATTRSIDQAVRDIFQSYGAIPLFLGYPGKTPFPAATCVSVNEEVVHGIPGDRKLVVGDIVSVDTGCSLNGWCGDAAMTHAVGSIDLPAAHLLRTTQAILNLAIEQLAVQTCWSAVARKMQQLAQREGLSVIESLVGHGIGRQMHEAPQVPNYFDPRLAEADFEIRPGLVIAIEPMINAGGKGVRTLADHWTVISADRSLAAHFEHTVAVTAEGVRRLTGPPRGEELAWVGERYRDAAQWVEW